MQRITVKELISFRRKSDRSKKTWANVLKTRKPKEKSKDNKGGNYWVTSTSCIQNIMKSGDKGEYDSKIDDLLNRFKNSTNDKAKKQYQQNIDILTRFKEVELDDIKPSEVDYQKVLKTMNIIEIDKFPVFVNPNLVFSFDQNGNKTVGAIWLVAQKGGFSKDELGMFCEMLYRFLNKNYSDSYQIAHQYCIVIDTLTLRTSRYDELTNGDIPFLIEGTLKSIKEL